MVRSGRNKSRFVQLPEWSHDAIIEPGGYTKFASRGLGSSAQVVEHHYTGKIDILQVVQFDVQVLFPSELELEKSSNLVGVGCMKASGQFETCFCLFDIYCHDVNSSLGGCSLMSILIFIY